MVYQRYTNPNAIISIDPIEINNKIQPNEKLRIGLAETNFHLHRFEVKMPIFGEKRSLFNNTKIGKGVPEGIISGSSLKMNKHDISLQKKLYKELLDNAVKKKINIICFPELNFPYVEKDDYENESFFKDLHEYADKYNLVIIAGSYLDTHNTCPIIFPHLSQKYEQHKISLSNEERQNKSVIPNIAQNIFCFKTQIGDFYILICSDAYDENIKQKLINHIKNKKETDRVFIFVPSYDKNKEYGGLYKRCIELSEDLSCLVAIVNDKSNQIEDKPDPQNERNKSNVFLFGNRLSRNKKDSIIIEQSECGLFVYDIFIPENCIRSNCYLLIKTGKDKDNLN